MELGLVNCSGIEELSCFKKFACMCLCIVKMHSLTKKPDSFLRTMVGVEVILIIIAIVLQSFKYCCDSYEAIQ